MAQHKPTPEEQLLKLIENPSAAKSQPSAKASEPKEKKSLFDFLKKSDAKQKTESVVAVAQPKPLEIRNLNQIMVALVFAAFIYLVLDLTLLKPEPKNFLAQVSVSDAVFTPPILEEKGTKKDLAYYQEMLERRNPFMAPGTEPEAPSEDQVPVPAPQSNKMTEVLGNLKLVGITGSADGPLVMIEEASTGRTFFIKEGQEVNGVKIQAIDKQKVTVTYEGEEGNLY